MNSVVVAGALAVAGINALATALGAWLWYRERESRAFWALLRGAQLSAVLFAVGVGVLAAFGRDSSESLFYLYALLPIPVSFIAEQLRVTAAQAVLDKHGLDGASAVGELPVAEQRALVSAILRREMSIMTLSTLVVVFLALRAAATAHGF